MKYNTLFVSDHMAEEVISNLKAEAEALDEAADGFEEAEGSVQLSVVDNVGIVEASGTLIPGDAILPDSFDLVTYGSIVNGAKALAEIEGVDSLLMEINSPGGTVIGSVEAAEQLAELAKEVNIEAHTSIGAFSAAFMLTSAVGGVHANPTASVGSIGVRATHESLEGMLGSMGVKITELAIGNKKNLGSPFKDLTESEQEAMLEELQEPFDMFVNIVNQGTGVSKEDIIATEAGTFMAKTAVQKGLAKSVITFDKLLDNMRGTKPEEVMSEPESNIGTKEMTEKTLDTEEGQLEVTAEEAIPEQTIEADTYMVDVMSKLNELGRLDAMPSIVERKIQVEGIEEELNYKGNLTALCKVAGAEEDAEAFITNRTPLAEAKAALFDKMVATAQATNVDSSRADSAPEQTEAKRMSVNDIFAARKSATEHNLKRK